MDIGDAAISLFFLTNKSPSSLPCLTPDHKRDMVVFFVITMFMLPAVTCAGTVSGTSGNETDRIALLAIKAALKDPLGALNSWSSSVHHCYWKGIICGRHHRRVVELELSSTGLGGTISPYIGNLSFLHSIYFSNNTLEGPIPAEIRLLLRLSTLVLNYNSLIGEIPSNLSNCLNLQLPDVTHNSLEGRMPPEFSSFSMLPDLLVSSNNLSGQMFSIIQNLTSLEYISAAYNAFHGIIPAAIGQMKNLTYLALGMNQLTGMLPSSIYNISSIRVLSFQGNRLHGSLPANIASTLPNLAYLQLGENHFTGPLPVTLSNISSLRSIQLYSNKFTGKVPWNFQHLMYLRSLDLDDNSLGSGDADDISFLNSLVNCTNLEILGLAANNFGGVLPNAVGNLSAKLFALELSYNFISGSLPTSLSQLSNLVRLNMNNNQLSGTMFSDIGKLQKLEHIDFSMNMFTGTIPESLGNLPKLSELYLSQNNFQGAIPSSLGNCQYLTTMYVTQNNLTGAIPKDLFGGPSHLIELGLGQNHLEGPLPVEIGQQKNMIRLDVSKNKLLGEIPSTLSSCSSLLYLHMEANMFHGHIPTSLSFLKSIQELDLSHNNFSGPIPAYLSKFPLTYLNLSYNYFEGEVPVGGVFANESAISLVGNPELCGGIDELHLPRCQGKEVIKAKIPFKLRLIISCACALVGAAIVISIYYICRRKKQHSPLPVSSFREPFFNVSYKMLLKATEGFSSSNFLGAGAFGSVFKGVLEHSQTTVAVKVLNLQQPGASKSFAAECKALRNVRHRNLVRVITACSSVDYEGNNFKALVYEYMHGGSLENWLHSNQENHDRMLQVRNLSLLQRVNIALDVASALQYLHHDCEVPIIHRDLKPSNILLDNEMVAHVGDFGLAKFLPITSYSNQSNSIGVKGTIGYTPPEYGLGADLSAAGDIYSYGIMVLEVMTGKRPTNDMFKEGLNLHTYAKMALSSDQVVQIVDTRLLDNEGYVLNNVRIARHAATWMNCAVTMMKIGVACSMESPQDRINLKDASTELLKVKADLVQWTSVSHHQNFEAQVVSSI